MYSLFSLIRQGNTLEAVIFVLSGCFVVFVCSPIHELSHGWVAYKLGDRTAKMDGRLTFNPIAHIDPIGMIMILLFGFGYAKPVPVSMRNLKNPKRDMALVAIAGPLSNIVLAFISINLFYIFSAFIGGGTVVKEIILNFLLFSSYINLSLAAFNLIPIPPLDGSKVLAAVLPDRTYYKYMQYERYAMIILLILLATGALDSVISFISGILMRFISIIPNLIFR